MNVLQHFFRAAGDRNGQVLRDRRENVRRFLHELLHVVDTVQALLDTPFIVQRDLMSRRNLLT